MDSKLNLTIDTLTAFQKSKELEMQISGIGDTADKAADEATKAFQRLGQATQTPINALRNLDANLATSTKGIYQLNVASQQAAASLGSGGAGGGSTGGGGGGTGGGGLGGAAGGASSQLLQLAQNAARAALAYISLRTALRLGEDIVRTRIEFDRLDYGLRAITGSWGAAQKEADFLTATTQNLGLNLRQTIPEFVKIEAAFSQSGFTGRQTQKIFEDLSITSKALGLSSQNTNRVLYDFQEMASLGTVQMRQFRAVMMQIPGGMDIAARSMGITTTQLHDMIHNGRLAADEFLPKFTEELRKTFGGAMSEASQNLESQVNRMVSAWDRLKANLGKSEGIKSGIQGVGGLLDAAAIIAEMRNAGSFGAGGSDFLNQRFPFADKFGASDKDFGMTGGIFSKRTVDRSNPDYVNAYRRMFQQQQMREQSAFQVAPLPSKEERSASEQQIDAIEKIRLLQEKAHIEELTGLKKEEAQIELNADKQLDALTKYLKLFDPIKDKSKIESIFSSGDPFSAITEGKNSALGRAREGNQSAIDSKTVGELVDAYQRMINIKRDLIGAGSYDREATETARINDEYNRLRETLSELDQYINVPAKMFEQVEAARQKSLQQFGGKNSMESFRIGLKETESALGSFQSRVKESAIEIGQSLDQDITKGLLEMGLMTKDVGTAFRDMSLSIASDLLRIAIQEYVVRTLLRGLAGLGGGGGGVPANFSHSGGGLGESMPGRMVNPALFFGAQKFHGGGVIGDEMPIVARKGEVIFTPEQMAALGKTISGATGKEKKVEIANYFDPQMIDERIAANPDLILNAIGKRKSAFRALIRE